MSFATTTQNDSDVIRIPSRFDFSLMKDFNRTVDEVIQRRPEGRILVDFANTDYLDSAALGMLLILRDRARRYGRSVVLASASGAVRDVLNIANFSKLFDIR